MKTLNERISEWAHFLNLVKHFWRCLSFSAPKSRGSFRQDLEGTYNLKSHEKENFCNLWRINTHNFKNDQKLSKMIKNLKDKAYLVQNVMEFDMKRVSDPKALTFGIWDLKTC